MYIQAVGTASPARRYSQRECWELACRSPEIARLNSRSRAILRKVLTGENGIEHRHLALATLEEVFSIDPNTLHGRFREHAPRLAAAAARNALERAELTAGAIDALIISTCTGYLCPGLTSYVSESLGIDSRAYLADLVGHGCGAALPNLKLASAVLAANQARNVLCVSVEVCSAAFYLDDDPGVLISACLFGDGAGAVVCSTDPGRAGRRIRWTHYAGALNPRDRDLLRFEMRDGMLRNVLDKSVPVLVVDLVREVTRDLFRRSGKSAPEISEWILHAGGRDILAALRSGLDLPREKLRWSEEVLREKGNVSSASILFALEKALEANAPGGTWLLATFGAGISCHGALLEVE